MVIISARNWVFKTLYKGCMKPVFFQVDPEKVHDAAVSLGVLLGSNFITRSLTRLFFSYKNKALEQEILGIKFKNPVGLAAGFDKNAGLTKIIPSVGFGFEQVGSITGEPCEGNPKPRLWRLKKSKGLVVYYGLKNNGCVKIARHLKKQTTKIPLGISIAKTNSKKTVPTKSGIADYLKAYKTLRNVGSFHTINISCPNSFGGRSFTESKKLNMLLREINKTRSKKPIFIKISPDLSLKEVDAIIKISRKHRINGFVISNLTKKRKNKKIRESEVSKKGGISGKPVEDLSNKLIKYVYKKTKGDFIIIGCGGIFTAEDAYEKIKSGASLVQLITGMIFEGPQQISQINSGLVRLLKKDGFSNISEAIGKDLST